MRWWTLWKLRSSDSRVRVEAAELLGSAGGKKAVPDLIPLLGDESLRVRQAAIAALGKSGHPAAAEPLVGALLSSSRPAQSRGTRPKNQPEKYDYDAFARALAGLGAAVCEPLFQALGSDDREARRCAVQALGMIRDPRAVAPLGEKLEDARSEVRKAAAQALADIGDPRAAASLIKALGHRDPETRRAAASALGVIGGPDHGAALSAAVQDPDEGVQLAAIRALAKIGGTLAIAGLGAALETGKRAVRDAAAEALKSPVFQSGSTEESAAIAVLLGDYPAALSAGPAAVGPLLAALGSKDAGRRRRTAQTLAQLRPERAVPGLLRALKDSDAGVQEAAALALVAIGPPAFTGLRDSLASYDAVEVKLAANALGSLGDIRAGRALADAIAANRRVTSSYPEQGEAARAAASALTTLLINSPAAFSREDLEYIVEVPDIRRVRDAGGVQGSRPEMDTDCSQVRELARKELSHR